MLRPLLLPCGRLIYLILIALCVHPHPIDGTRKPRVLYDYALNDDLALKVRTYSTIIDPVGITVGEYSNTKGLFVSSFESNSISFISLEHGGHTRQMEAVTIAGGVYGIDSDGSFDTASFAEPSRLSYDDQCRLLFVICKKNRVIRVLNFEDKSVKTLQTDQDEPLTFESGDQYQFNFPGFDIQGVSGDSLYVTDTAMLYRVVVSGHDPFCESIATSAALVVYQSLHYYMQVHDYPSNSRIYSVLPVEGSSILYVAIGEGKNVLLKIPINAVYSNQYVEISKLAGNDGMSWNGLTTTQTPPVATNGVASSHNTGSVTLAFPMHLQMDKRTNTLFWTECYPYVGEFLLGSLAVRRIALDSGWVDFYAGYDFSQDMETYPDVGTEGGYINGVVTDATFRYPVSIAYFDDDEHAGEGEGSLYVADKSNNAIRRVAVVVDTPAPTAVFSNAEPSSAPSKTPTQRPTVSSEPTATYYPTLPPSAQPTLSIAPTSHPSKRPTRRPTMKPTTLEPTSASVWIQDNSILNTLGFGTVHVGIGMYLGSVSIGLLVASLIILAYTQRHRNPHQQLRTTEHLQEYEDAREYYGRKFRFAGNYCVYLMGVCIPGSAFHSSGHEDSEGDDQGDTGDTREHSSRSSFIQNIWHTLRDVPSLVSIRRHSNSHSGSEVLDDDSETSSASSGIHSILQSVRESSSSELRRNTQHTSSYAHTSMSPQEYRELTPREQRGGSRGGGLDSDLDELDDSARSTTPMIVRTFGSSYDGL